MHRVEIVGGREDSLKAQTGSVGERFLPAPRLDQNIFRKIGIHDLVPTLHVLAVLLDDLLKALIEVRLQLVVVLEIVLFLEVGDVYALVPLGPLGHFIAADVEVLIGKQRGHFADEFVQEFVGGFAGHIESAGENAPGVFKLVGAVVGRQNGHAGKPGGHVAGHVELRNHSNAAVACVGYDLLNLGLCEVVVVGGPEFLELGEKFALDAEALVVCEMPVKHIHFHGGHRVELSKDDRQWHPVPAYVDHEAAPGEPRFVVNSDDGNKVTVRPRLNELQKRFEAVENAERVGRREPRRLRRYDQLVALVFIEGLHRLSCAEALHGENQRRLRLAFVGGWKRRNTGDFRKLLTKAIHGGPQAGIGWTGERGAERLIDREDAIALDDFGGYGHDGQRLCRGRRDETENCKSGFHFDWENFAGSKKLSGAMETMRQPFFCFTSSAWTVSWRSIKGPDASRLRIWRIQSRSTERLESSPSSLTGSIDDETTAWEMRASM